MTDDEIRALRVKNLEYIQRELCFWSDEDFVLETFRGVERGLKDLEEGLYITLEELRKELNF